MIYNHNIRLEVLKSCLNEILSLVWPQMVILWKPLAQLWHHVTFLYIHYRREAGIESGKEEGHQQCPHGLPLFLHGKVHREAYVVSRVLCLFQLSFTKL